MEGRLESTYEKSNAPATAIPLSTREAESPLVGTQLLFELQSTLDLEQLMAIFFRHLQGVLPCQALRYRHPGLGLDVSLGRAAHHSAEYQLRVAGESLGKVRFQRRRPFSEAELEQIETLLSALVLPVRNAVRYQQALQAAHVDPLTGLQNRRAYEDHLEREISRARREGQPLGLMVVDIDHFKAINDGIGHLAGDQVLIEVGRVLRASVRKSDMVFRYAGDEFVLLLPNVRPDCLRTLVRRLERAVRTLRCHYGDHAIEVSVSIGAALLEEGMDGGTLFAAADLDMYRTKESRRRGR